MGRIIDEWVLNDNDNHNDRNSNNNDNSKAHNDNDNKNDYDDKDNNDDDMILYIGTGFLLYGTLCGLFYGTSSTS